MAAAASKGRKPLFSRLSDKSVGFVLSCAGLLAGCAGAVTSLPEPTPPASEWVASGVTKDGCTYYTKKPVRMGVVVDAGIWVKRADGTMTLNLDLCGK